MTEENKIERYGISAEYSFDASENTFATMKQVVAGLQTIEDAVKQTSSAIKQSGLAQNLRQMANQAGGAIGQATQQMQQMGQGSKQTGNQLQQLAQEFRALRAESKAIDLSEIADPQQFKKAETGLNEYIRQLEQLKKQIDTTTPQGRQMAAQIQREQMVASRQIGKINQQAQSSSQDAARQLGNLGKEFRALRAEAQNIDFGDLDDPNQFKQATQQIEKYITELKKLEAQVDKTSPEGRTLAAQMQRSQTIAGNRLDRANLERQSAKAQERQGMAAGVAGAGAAVMLPMIGLGKEAISTVSEFSDQMMEVKAVLDPKDWGMLDAIRQKAKDLGASTRYSASEAASGFVLLAQAGYDVDKQMKAIDGTLSLAAAGNLQLARATEITVSTLGQFQIDATKATHVANVLAKAAAMGQLDVNDMGESLKYAGGSAKRANVSFEQTSAMLALLSEGGLKGEMAGSNLASMMDSITAPSSTASKALRQLGIITKDARGNLLPFDRILGQLNNRLSKMGSGRRASFESAIFGTTGGRAASILLPRLSKLGSATSEIMNTADQGIGSAAEQAQIMESDIGGAFRSLQSAMQGAFIEIGERIAPAVKAATQAITGLLKTFIKLPEPIKTAIILTGAIVTGLATLAVVLGTVGIAFFGFQAAMAQAAIGMSAMAGAGVPLTGFFATVMQAFSTGGIITGFAGLGTSISTAAAALGAFITGPVGLLLVAGAAIVGLLEILTPGFNVLGTVVGVALSPIAFTFGLVRGALQGLWVALKPVVTEFSGMSGDGKYLSDVMQTIAKVLSNVAGVGKVAGKVLGFLVGAGIATPLKWLIKGFKFLIGMLRGVGMVAGTIAAPFVWAIQQIGRAWQGFVDWFQKMPLVKFALDIAQKLINALNHNPTERIPEAWDKAVQRIQGLFEWLGRAGQATAEVLSYLLDPSRIFKGILRGLITLVQNTISTIQDSGIGQVLDKIGFDAPIDGLQAGLEKLKAMTEDKPLQVEVIPKLDSTIQSVAETKPVSLAVQPVVDKPDLTSVQSIKPSAVPIQPTLSKTPALGMLPTPTAAPTLQTPNLSNFLSALTTQLETAKTIAAQTFGEIKQSWLDNWSFLQRSGTTDLSQLFAPGIDTLKAQLSTVRQDFQSFAQETIAAIGSMDWEKAKQSAQNFGTTLSGAAQSAGKAIGGLTLSTIALGVFSLTSLSPLVLILGGIGLTALAIATDFLGIRTAIMGVMKMIGGLINVVRGAIEVFVALLTTATNTVQGILKVLDGILPALRGDFSQMQAGWNQITQGFQAGAIEISQAFGRMGRGIGQVFEGAFQVVHGIGEGIFRAITGTAQAIKLIFQGIGATINGTAKLISLIGEGFRAIPSVVGEVGQKIQAKWQALNSWISNLNLVPDLSSFSKVGDRISGVLSSAKTLIQTGVEQIHSIWNGLKLNLPHLDLSPILGLPDRIQGIVQQAAGVVQSAIARIQQIWQTLTFHFPTLDLSHLTALPNRIQGVVQQATDVVQSAIARIQQIWQTLTFHLPTLDLSHLTALPDRIQGIITTIRSTFDAGTTQIRSTWDTISHLALPGLKTVIDTVKGLPPIFEGAIERIKSLWSGVGDKISSVLGFVRGKSKQVGEEITHNLSENSPGPTFQIRMKWAMTAESVQERMVSIAQQAKLSGQQIADRVVGGFEQIQVGAKAKLSGVKQQISSALNGKGVGAVGRSFSSVGMALSNISPQLAAPLFVMSDLIDTSQTLSETLPEAQKFFTGLLPKVKGLGGAVGGLVPKLAGMLSGLIPILTSLSTTAITALGAVVTPLLPIIGTIAAIGIGVILLRKAWQKNFLGIRSLVETIGSAIQSLFAGILKFADRFLNPLRLIQGLFSLIRQGLSGLGKLFIPLMGITTAIQGGWQGFKDWFNSLFNGLPIKAADASKKVQQALYTPTKKVPPPWEAAVQKVKEQIGSLTAMGQSIDLPQMTSPTIQPTIAPIPTITSPTIQPTIAPVSQITAPPILASTAPGLATIPPQIAQIKTGMEELGQTWQAETDQMQQQGIAAFTSVFSPLADRAKTAFGQLHQRVAEFVAQVQALMSNVTLDNLNEGIQGIGKQLKASVQQAGNSLNAATLSAIAFGVTSLLSLSPIILILGAIGLGALAIATNFLGVRTAILGVFKIVTGLFNTVRGGLETMTALITTVINAARSMAQILGGIPAAFRGDPSQMQAGFGSLVESFQTGASQIKQAFNRIGRGVGQIFEGAYQVVSGIVDGLIRLFQGLGQAIELVFKGASAIVTGLGRTFQLVGDGIQSLPGIVTTAGDKLKATWQNVTAAVHNLPFLPNLQDLQQLPDRVAGIFNIIKEQVQKGITQIQSAWQSWNLHLPEINLSSLQPVVERTKATAQQILGFFQNLTLRLPELNLSNLLNVPERISSTIAQIQATWTKLNLPFPEIKLSALQTIPDRVHSLISQVQNYWNSLALKFPLPDLSSLEGVSDRVRGVISATQEVIAAGIAQIRSIWQTLTTLDDVPILQGFVDFAKTLPDIFQAAIEQIKSLWGGLGDKVKNVFGFMRGKSKETGQEMISNLAENSPGPTFQIRQKWQMTAERIQAYLSGVAEHAQVTGQQIATQITAGTQQAATAAKTKLGAIGQSLNQALGGKGVYAMGRSFSSVGMVLSNFAPQAAAPLFMLSDLVDTSQTLSETLPETQKFFTGLLPKVKGLGGAVGGLLPKLGGLVSGIIPLFGSLGTAATTALAAIAGPLLPIIAGIAAVIAVGYLLYQAFKQNFLGIRSLVQGVGKALTGTFKLIGAVVQGIADLIGNTFGAAIQTVVRVASSIGSFLIAPFVAAKNQIQSAWQGFQQWFSGLMGGLPNLAAEAGKRIIGFLNHNPTIVIPDSWEGAVQRISGDLSTLPGVAQDVGQQMVGAIQPDTIPNQLSDSIGAFGETASTVAGQVSNGFKGMTLASVAFGVSSLTSLAPIALIMAGIALAALAVATNFLGIRTILGGLWRVIQGVVEIAVSGFKAVLQVLKGLFQILGSVPAALMGDFSGILAGWQVVAAGMKQAADSLMSGMQTIFGGGAQVIRGIFEGLGQIVKVDVFDKMLNAAREFVSQVQAWFEKLSSTMTTTLSKPAEMMSGLFRRKQKGVAPAASPILESQAIVPDIQAAPIINAVPLIPESRAVQQSPSVSIAQPQISSSASSSNLDSLTQQLSTAESGIETIQSRTQTALNATTSGISSLGVALSNFAPQLAAPLFILTDMIDGFLGVTQAIPVFKAAIVGSAAVTATTNVEMTASNLALAGSNEMVAATSLRTRLAMMLTAVQQKAIAASNWVVSASNWVAVQSQQALSSATVQSGLAMLWNQIQQKAATTYNGMVAASNWLVATSQQAITWATSETGLAMIGATLQKQVSTAWNWLLAASNQAVAGTTTEAGLTMLWYSIQSKAAVVWNGILMGWNWLLSLSFEGIAVAATAAWSAVLAPIMPVVLAIGAVVGAVVLLWQAFKNNWGGMGDAMSGVMQGIQDFFAQIWNGIKAVVALGVQFAQFSFSISPIVIAFKMLWGVIQGVLVGVVAAWNSSFAIIAENISTTFGTIKQVIVSAFQPFSEMFAQLSSSLNQSQRQVGGLGTAISALVNILLIPTKLITAVLGVLLRAIGLIMQALVVVGGVIFKALLVPFRIVAGVVMGIIQIGLGVKDVFMDVLGSVWGALQSIAQAFQPMFDAITQIGTTLRDALSPLLGKAAGGDSFGAGIKAVIKAVLIPIRVIAGIIQVIFKAISLIIKLVAAVLSPVIRGLAVPIQIVATTLKIVVAVISTIFNVIGSIVSFIGSALQSIYNLIPAPIRWFLETIGKGIGSVVSFLFGSGQQEQAQPTQKPQKFASGGLVTNPGLVSGAGGGTSDRIPAMLSNGEFVMRAAATRMFMPWLNAMNQGQNPIASLMGGMQQQQSSFVQALLSGTPAKSALQLLPIAPPAIPQTPIAPAQQAKLPEGVSVTVQLTIQNITVVSDSDTSSAARRLAEEVQPEFERMVRDALRDIVEKMR